MLQVEETGGACIGTELVLSRKSGHAQRADPAQQDVHHDGVHHALDQRHGDHVAIRHVGHLVADDGFDLGPFIDSSNPVETVNIAGFLKAPVANASARLS